MSLPKPPLDLTGSCSVVYDNVLYIYSPAGFQSLPLKKGATWTVLSPGVSVTGGACVNVLPADSSNAALYIVGGSTNASTTSYPGLQRYSFHNNTWETITPAVLVTQNRQNHGAAYINSTSQILVYAGSQVTGDNGPSSQTFLISTTPPYNVLSYTSTAPPLTAPMIMPWDASNAVMVGGGPDNKDIYIFSPNAGWQNLGTSLPNGIANQSTTQCALMTGDDGSKVLEVYNMGVTPNEVTQYVLLTASGAPAAPGQTVGSAPPSNKKRKRQHLSVNNWPAYNDSLAPTVARSDYSIAESNDGLAVISGGNVQEPLAIFDQRADSWVDVTKLLGVESQAPLTASSMSLPSVSVVKPTATGAVTAASPGGAGQSSRTLTILGGILGGIFGLAALLVILLVMLRWQREKRDDKETYINEKDDRLSFADQGTDYMDESSAPATRGYSSHNNSASSLQIFNKGKAGRGKHVRGMPSDSSQVGLVKHSKNPHGTGEPMEMSHIGKISAPMPVRSLSARIEPSPPHPVADPSPLMRPSDPRSSGSSQGVQGRSRSNGWSRYFANNEVTNLASMQQSQRDTIGTDATYRSSGSNYHSSRGYSGSLTGVKPLELNLGPKFDGQRLSRVAMGSPTMGRSKEDVREAQSAEITGYDSNENPNYTSTFNFSDNDYSSTDKPEGKSTLDSKSTTSSKTPPTTVPYFSVGTDYFQNQEPTSSFSSPRPRKSSEGQKAFGFPKPNPFFGGSMVRDSADSNMTVFPTTFSSVSAAKSKPANAPKTVGGFTRQLTNSEDMSWLNLNADRDG